MREFGLPMPVNEDGIYANVHLAVLAAVKRYDRVHSSNPDLHQFTPFENVGRASDTLKGVPSLLFGQPHLAEELIQKNQKRPGTMLVIPEFPLVFTDSGRYITATAPVLSGTKAAIEKASSTMHVTPDNYYYFLYPPGWLDRRFLEHMTEGKGAFGFDPSTMNPSDFISLAVSTFCNEMFQLHMEKGDETFTPRFVKQNKDLVIESLAREGVVFEVPVSPQVGEQKVVFKEEAPQAEDSLLTEEGEAILDKETLAPSEWSWKCKSLMPNDRGLAELERMARDEQWVKALTREGMTIGRAFTLMRLDLLLGIQGFAQKANIHRSRVREIEKNERHPVESVVNAAIEASNLEQMGLPAQMIRLLREARSPMEASKLKDCSPGNFFQYMRQLRGDSFTTAVRAMRINIGRTQPTEEEAFITMHAEVLKQRLLKYLRLDPKSAIGKIAEMKIDSPKIPISDSLIQEVITGERDGRFLFAEMLHDYDASPEINANNAFSTLVEKVGQFEEDEGQDNLHGMIITYLREGKSLSRHGLSRSSALTGSLVYPVEDGKITPRLVTTAKLFKTMGIDILDPLAWYLVEQIIRITERY